MKSPSQHDDPNETEVTYQITVPEEGGWGWVVVLASFYSMLIQNGIVFTFGSLINCISRELKTSAALVALVGSLQTALYFMVSPFASAIINRFGFRACSIMGSITCALAMIIAYMSQNYIELVISYGVINGIGLAFLNMASLLIVGFYFEKRRSLALSVTSLGASLGTMIMFPLNSYLVSFNNNWRAVVLLQAGLMGAIYFVSLAYRPLPTLTVVPVDEKTQAPTRSVAVVPRLSVKEEGKNLTTKSERFFGAVANERYPVAKTLLQALETKSTVTISAAPGPSKESCKSVILKPSTASTFTPHQLKLVKSLATSSAAGKVPVSSVANLGGSGKGNEAEKEKVQIILDIPEQPPSEKKKQRWWKRCFAWEPEEETARPMYRDDTFYEGKIEKLPEYTKSVMSVNPEQRTGLEYQMAVARAITTEDIKERKGLCSIAVKRVLATMLDFGSFMKMPYFIIICISGLLCYVGMLVPYVFVTDRNKKEGLDSTLFISIAGFATTCGRLVFGVLGDKYSPIKIYAVSLMMTGISTALSNLNFTLLYQYVYCLVFGFFVSGVITMRCLVLIRLYGLSKLTNATGVFHLFLGTGCVISTPLASAIRDFHNYTAAFNVAGGSSFLSGLLIMFVKTPKDTNPS